jgi:hypothetical protein
MRPKMWSLYFWNLVVLRNGNIQIHSWMRLMFWRLVFDGRTIEKYQMLLSIGMIVGILWTKRQCWFSDNLDRTRLVCWDFAGCNGIKVERNQTRTLKRGKWDPREVWIGHAYETRWRLGKCSKRWRDRIYMDGLMNTRNDIH